jgi:hypothetical protein
MVALMKLIVWESGMSTLAASLKLFLFFRCRNNMRELGHVIVRNHL